MLHGSTPTFSTETYAETLAKLRSFETFLQDLGVHKGSDRLGVYIRTIENLGKAIASDKLREFVEKTENRLIGASLHEAMILGEVSEHLRSFDPEKLKAMPHILLQGQAHLNKLRTRTQDRHI